MKINQTRKFPDLRYSQGTQEYGPFKVTLIDQQVFADYTIRQLLVAVSMQAHLVLI